MDIQETLMQISINLKPEQEAVFRCPTVADAKAWYMRYRRGIDAAKLTDTLTVSRIKNGIIITRLTPPPVPVIQNREKEES